MKHHNKPWPTLPEAFRKLWTKALRSGEYKQSEGMLYNEDEDGFCCIGLAAHLCGARKEDMDGLLVVANADSTCLCSIPEGFPEELVGVADQNTLIRQLADMNDGNWRGKQTFSEIADWIDEHLS